MSSDSDNPFKRISIPELESIVDCVIEDPSVLQQTGQWGPLLDAAKTLSDQDRPYRLNQAAVTVLENPVRTSALETVLRLSVERNDRDVFGRHFAIATNEISAQYALGLGLSDTMLMYAIPEITSTNFGNINTLADFIMGHTESHKGEWQKVGANFFNNLAIQSPEHTVALEQVYHKLKGYVEDKPELNLNLMRVARSAFEYSTPSVNSVLWTALSELRGQIPEDEQYYFAQRFVGSKKIPEILETLSPNVGSRLTLSLIDERADNFDLQGKADLLEAYTRYLKRKEELDVKLPTERILSLGIKILEHGEERKQYEETVLDYLYKFNPSLIPALIERTGYAKSRNVEEVSRRLANLKPLSPSFDLETQLVLGRNLLPLFPSNEVFSFMSKDGRRALVQEQASQEQDYNKGRLWFDILVQLIEEDPRNEKGEDIYLSGLGKRLSERQESATYQNLLALFDGFFKVTTALKPHAQESGKADQSYAAQAMDLGMRVLEMGESREDKEFLSKMFDVSAAYASNVELMSAVDKTNFTDFRVFSMLYSRLEEREKSRSRLTSRYVKRVVQEMEQAASEGNYEMRKDFYKRAVDAILVTGHYKSAYSFAKEHAFSYEKIHKKSQYLQERVRIGGRRRKIDIPQEDIISTETKKVDYSGYVADKALTTARHNRDSRLEITALLWRGKKQDVNKVYGVANRYARQLIGSTDDTYLGIENAISFVESFGLETERVPVIKQTVQKEMQAAGIRMAYNEALRWAELGKLHDMIETYKLLAQSIRR